MFLKRLGLLIILTASFTTYSGGIPVSVSYVNQKSANQAESVDLVKAVTIGSKATLVNFENTDSLFRIWKISGAGFDGSAQLFVSKERGIGWQIGMDGDSLKVLIARDLKNASDPRLISITTNFVAGLFMLENFEPTCNSYFKLYALKNSWDADVEYVGAYAFEMESSSPCSSGSWKVKTGKLKVHTKVVYAAIFSAIMTHNIRPLFKDYVL
ncbi:MAG: hypothetical protein IPO32_13280 [Crocinitomicaceae bacterium]|nr:hypothetical protein [Crocinitomicaceae bacterium]MBK9592413.1 hypothetical protein [Crocinitomicaceae bacterium]